MSFLLLCFSLLSSHGGMWWCSNQTLNPTPPARSSFLTLCFPVALLPPFPTFHPCSSCRAAPGYSLKSSAHPVHPSPPWSLPPGCWAPSRSCAPTSQPFLWSLSRLPLTLKVCALSSSIPKVIPVLHSCTTWPQYENSRMFRTVCRAVSVSVVWVRWIHARYKYLKHHFVSVCLTHPFGLYFYTCLFIFVSVHLVQCGLCMCVIDFF